MRLSSSIANDPTVLGSRKFGRGEKETVTVFGCTGFLGRYVVNALGRAGCTVYVPFRGDDMEWRHLKLMGDLGQINPIPFSARDEDSVRNAVKNSNTVINLIGKHYETKHLFPWWVNNTLHDCHVKAAQTIAKVSANAGVERFMHVSALSADHNSRSVWNRTKAEGEDAVRAAFPTATLVRPATIYGAEDRFLINIGDYARSLGKIPVVNGGTQKLQPVDVQDVADAIVAVQQNSRLDGSTLDLAGPNVYTMAEIIQRVKEMTEQKLGVLDFPPALLEKIGSFVEMTPNPWLTADQVVMMGEDNVLNTNSEAVTFDSTAISMARLVHEQEMDALAAAGQGEAMAQKDREFNDSLMHMSNERLLGVVPGVLESHAYDYLRMFRRISKLSTA